MFYVTFFSDGDEEGQTYAQQRWQTGHPSVWENEGAADAWAHGQNGACSQGHGAAQVGLFPIEKILCTFQIPTVVCNSILVLRSDGARWLRGSAGKGSESVSCASGRRGTTWWESGKDWKWKDRNLSVSAWRERDWNGRGSASSRYIPVHKCQRCVMVLSELNFARAGATQRSWALGSWTRGTQTTTRAAALRAGETKQLKEGTWCWPEVCEWFLIVSFLEKCFNI